MPLKPLKTPCIGICKLDIANHYCIGCRRSEAEIEDWGGMSDEDRDLIMLKLAEREENGKN
jgi:predicted Fe-S protein YdhL (DUF1289 family)